MNLNIPGPTQLTGASSTTRSVPIASTATIARWVWGMATAATAIVEELWRCSSTFEMNNGDVS